MNRTVPAFGVCASLLFAIPALSAQSPQSQMPTSTPAARGEYLATQVAMCVQCHSPRDEKGEIIQSRRFAGGAIPLRSPYRDSEWAPLAPNIRGLSGFTDEQFIMLLTEGHAGERPAPRPPMPPFRMTADDARAILAFLRSQ